MKVLIISNLTEIEEKVGMNPESYAPNPDVYILGNIFDLSKDTDLSLGLNDKLKSKAVNYVSGPKDCFLDNSIILKRGKTLFTHGDIVDESFKRSNNLDPYSKTNYFAGLFNRNSSGPVSFSGKHILRSRYILDTNECDTIVMSYFHVEKTQIYNLGDNKRAVIVPHGFVNVDITGLKPVRR